MGEFIFWLRHPLDLGGFMEMQARALFPVGNGIADIYVLSDYLTVLAGYHAHIRKSGPHPGGISTHGGFRHRLGVDQCQSKNSFIAVLVFHHLPPAFPNMASLNSGK